MLIRNALTAGMMAVFASTAVAQAPSRLGFVSKPLVMTADGCYPVEMAVEGGGHTAPMPALVDTKINLDGQTGISFWSDSHCGIAVKYITVPKGSPYGVFYVKVKGGVGAYQIRIQASGYSAVTQSEQVVLNGPPPVPPPVVPPPVTPPPPPPPPPVIIPPPPPPPPVTGVVAPAQAAALGFNTLAFDDEFTTDTAVNTTLWSMAMPAGNYAFGSTGMTIKTDSSGYSDAMTTHSAWQHGYFEARLQFSPTGHTSGAWPAFWSYALEASGSLPVGTHFAELDGIECYPTGASCTILTTVHEWTAVAGRNTGTNVQNPDIPKLPTGIDLNAWHTWGVLWSPNSITWYLDNAPLMTTAVGPGTNFPSVERDHMQWILGTGANWPMTVSYVRFWQAP